MWFGPLDSMCENEKAERIPRDKVYIVGVEGMFPISGKRRCCKT